MVASAQKIVISGYYGFRNSGDEAVLQSILNALQRQSEAAGIVIEPVVLSIDPESTTATYGVKSVHRMKLGEVRRAIAESAGLISGGGSLLQDVTSSKTIPYYLGVLKLAQWIGKPTFIYAQGVGPVNRKLFHPLIKSVFRNCAYVSVRDEQSRSLLQSMGLNQDNIQVVPDPVMGLELPQRAESPGVFSAETASGLKTVGISIRFWEESRYELNEIAEGLLKACAQIPFHLRFLPFHHPTDNEASRYLMEKLEKEVAALGGSISIREDALHPQQMLSEVAECDVLIGMRLHSLIYAAGRRVPLIGVSYDPKIDHFLERIRSRPVGSTGTLEADKVAAEILLLLEQGEAWKQEREPLIAALVEEAEAPARRIAEYLCSKG
ncbi:MULTISPECIES: polysaccharide pyruvyl transferase CsaB [unclassified Paenibacillus]|uniref:polysaccharide pyruvyl transferase CsaB n=1 Tax=unclassified Paenibacillus TaxID=185978 RepID=UPI002406236D|nr:MULTISPECIES: polysaccharide pyruvyl transferase CsaB [unclassified Paenibacillus]MDF9840116.1 polysaccharide pyruvyl transferase CsaB [Paenibacillus sp. PastF-2]MDF9846698.1 polysaccharide pyruvyl transferase CsaB [Paenibacillus sp. PastM-2]MDF9852953.1 polysaccharide pyruvyl transferase CsaB [Paenibacillus sp. PastF-1]MDH6478542.1 polysaccharide pyruvyl transferase CsaB [Paenibacillus sp. PastH-2]MDH6505960.1 polysaccharide pyruvyl transferase CsaB [Paenibacillus sp. PastM-3]